MRSRRHLPTRGFTLIELLTVLVIVGILAMITLPRFQGTMSGGSVRSANQQVGAYLRRARAAALETGRSAYFIRSGDSIQVLIDSGATKASYAPPMDLNQQFGVTLSASRDTISYDPRGFAVGLSGLEKILVVLDTHRDSVCILGLGRISSSRCGL